jgi:hypothetical protein
MQVTHVVFAHPDDVIPGVAARLFYNNTSLVFSEFVQRGKVYVMDRSSFIGPLIEEVEETDGESWR